MNDLQLPIARKEGLVIQEMPDEILVYDLNINKTYCLNQTAALIWKYCNGKNSILDITKSLERELKTTVPENLVLIAIDQFYKDDLLAGEIETKMSSLSRREAIKKIGFASMVALPVITMLSFPQTTFAGNCPTSVCSEASGSGGCQAGMHCCRGTCQTTGDPCVPACPV